MEVTRAGGALGIPGLYVTGDPGGIDANAKVGNLGIRIGRDRDLLPAVGGRCELDRPAYSDRPHAGASRLRHGGRCLPRKPWSVARRWPGFMVDSGIERATGLGSYLRIEPAHGVIEVGHLAFSPLLQRTAAATEAMYLMMRQVFELGYRRYEWKCDALNARSCRAAERLGFTFEGIFRQAVVYKGRNRDTAWYAVIDSDWPAIDAEFRRWLAPDNFDSRGVQRTPLQNGVPKTSR